MSKRYAIESCAILTTNANAVVGALHDRMPVIISQEKRDVWLNPDADPDQLVELLEPLPSDEIEFHEVSRMVNAPQNNSPECIEPYLK